MLDIATVNAVTGVLVDELSRASCDATPATGQVCVEKGKVLSASAGLGLTSRSAGVTGGKGGSAVTMGRYAIGSRGYLSSGNGTPTHPVNLPGSALVCTEGDTLNVRKTPRTFSTVTGSLRDGAIIRVEKFQIERAGSYPDKLGQGWYRISRGQSG